MRRPKIVMWRGCEEREGGRDKEKNRKKSVRERERETLFPISSSSHLLSHPSWGPKQYRAEASCPLCSVQIPDPQKSKAIIINSYFKPLMFGVVCYVLVGNWNIVFRVWIVSGYNFLGVLFMASNNISSLQKWNFFFNYLYAWNILINFSLLINQLFKLLCHLLETKGAPALFCALLSLGMAYAIRLTKLFF